MHLRQRAETFTHHSYLPFSCRVCLGFKSRLEVWWQWMFIMTRELGEEPRQLLLETRSAYRAYKQQNETTLPSQQIKSKNPQKKYSKKNGVRCLFCYDYSFLSAILFVSFFISVVQYSLYLSTMCQTYRYCLWVTQPETSSLLCTLLSSFLFPSFFSFHSFLALGRCHQRADRYITREKPQLRPFLSTYNMLEHGEARAGKLGVTCICLRYRCFSQPKHGAFNNGSKTLFVVCCMLLQHIMHFSLPHPFSSCLPKQSPLFTSLLLPGAVWMLLVLVL